MLKYTVLFVTVFCSVQSQRPWHAGSSNRLPQVLPQYIDERIAAEQAQAGQAAQAGQGTLGIPEGQGVPTIATGQGALGIPEGQAIPIDQGGLGIPAGQSAQGIPVGQNVQGIQTIGIDESVVGNRIGGGVSTLPNAAAPGLSATTMTIPSDLPIDAHGDIDLINRIKTWPRDKQPFWYINWQAIQAHRGDANNTAQPVQTQPNSRSFFAG